MPKERERCKTPRRTYVPPKLVVYGKVDEITRAVGNKGAKDGGVGRYHGTH